MPRTARIAPEANVYHVLTRGNNQQDIFHEESDFIRYLELVARYKDKYDFLLYHYVLMTNHVHLVLETTNGGPLSEIMKGINLSYAQHYKKKYRHIGHFWQDRYKSILISKDEYLLACGSYVELNPVRAGIVEDPKKYRWSSYRHYAYGKEDLIIDPHPIYRNLSGNDGKQWKKYKDFVRGMLKDKGAMRGEMEKKRVYGNARFASKIAGVYKTDAKIRPRGRPFKVGNENK